MDIGRFHIVSVLGTGSHGVVCLARDFADASSEPVALKVLNQPPDDDVSMLARLRDEARILAWLCHPNIVEVHRLLEKDERPVVVMEYVPGASILELVERWGALPLPVAITVAHQVAQALEAAHDTPGPDGRPMRIVHRDVKPANLLVAVDGRVKILDFGIAAADFADREAWDREGEVWGTRGYMAPERRNGGPDLPAVDVYALGATLASMVTGRSLSQLGAPFPPPKGWRSQEPHDRWLGELVEEVTGDGAEAVRELILGLCRYVPEERPTLHEMVGRIAAVAAVVGEADLPGYAGRCVKPIHDERTQAPPRGDPVWPDIEFLEKGGPVHDLAVETHGPPRPLALRSTEGPQDVEPLLATLRRAAWWMFWAEPRDPAAIAGALVQLRGTRDPRVISRAHELTRDRDPRIAEAAWELLAAAC